jgi:hypothetical protein
MSSRRIAAAIFALTLGCALALVAPRPALAVAAEASRADANAGALRARFEALRGEMRDNGFGQPLVLLSHDGGGVLHGEVYARIDHPFTVVAEGLHDARQWCEVLVLPFNVKGCEARDGERGSRLVLLIGRHKDSTPDDSYRLDFRFREEARDAGFMRIALRAPSGPFGTRDYRIVLEATPGDAGHTIVHLDYSYGYGWVSQLAMDAYLSTAGADNVGFTVERRDGEGEPVYVRGMRGVMERNTMRYFLAIQAYLDALASPPQRREDARLEAWFRATERYPRQLHEMALGQYLAMKHRELAWEGGASRPRVSGG